MEHTYKLRTWGIALFLTLAFGPTFSQTWNTLPANSLSWRFEDIFFIDEQTGWAVDGGGQILKTTNAGNSWVQQFTNSDYFFRSVEFLDENIGFAGTLSSALFKTEDGGQTWTNINSSLPQVPAGICGMSSPNDSTIYITGVFYGLAYFMKSTDRGLSWEHTNMASYALGLVDVHFKDENEGFLVGMGPQGSGLRARILRTTDGGQSWTVVHEGTETEERAWKIQFLTNDVVYVSVEELSPNPHYYKSTDGGLTWQDNEIISMVTSGTVQGVGFLTEDVGWVGGFNDLFFETTDGGQTWTHQPTIGSSFNRFWRMNGTTMYVGGLGIYKYTNNSIGIADYETTQPHGHQISVAYTGPGTSLIDLQLVNNTYVELSLYDLQGKRVQTIDANQRNKGEHQVLWQHDVPAGIYLLALYTYHGFETLKVVLE